MGRKSVTGPPDFFFSGSHYHFWFYPAVIYALLFIGIIKKLLGAKALSFLMPLALALYAVGLLGTGYLPLGQQLPGLRELYGAGNFEAVMHLCFLGFPSIVFGMAAAHSQRACSGPMLLIAAAAYLAEALILCLHLNWRENPQMLLSTPILTVLYLRWVHSCSLPAGKANPALCRAVSAVMYNVHPLILAVLALILPALNGLAAFVLCAIGSAAFGCMLYSLKKIKFVYKMLPFTKNIVSSYVNKFLQRIINKGI